MTARKLNAILFTALLVACFLASCGKPGPRTVDYPTISYSNTDVIDIESVELTDSATVLNIKATFIPHYWIKIVSDSYLMADGKKYAMRSAAGIETDKEFWMPDSGEAEFTLTFDPIPLSTKTLDFIEGDGEGAFRLLGVDISGKKHSEYPEGLPKDLRREPKDGALPDVAFEMGKTTINFHILEAQPEATSEYTLILSSLARQETFPVKFNDRNEAEFSVEQYGPAQAYLIDDGGTVFASLNLYPGETVDCYIDGRLWGMKSMSNRNKRHQPVLHRSLHNGRYSNLDAMLDRNPAPYNMQLYTGRFGDYHMTGREYLEFVKGQYTALSDSIDKSDAPEMAKEFNRLLLRNSALEAIAEYRTFLARNYMYSKDSYDIAVPLDSIPAMLSGDDFKEVASWFEVNDPRMLFAGRGIGRHNWNDNGVEGDLSKSLVLFDVAASKAYSRNLEQSDLDTLKTLSNPFFALAADSIARSTQRKFIELQKNTAVTPTPDVADDKVLDAILAPHKGKVVVVDLWNTWCGPCRMAIKATEPLKDGELKNDDIVFIYIADESSDPVKYLEMIPDIKGIHYKLTEAQKRVISERFNVDGIPYYILVDRDGKAQGRPDLRDHSKYVSEIKSKL